MALVAGALSPKTRNSQVKLYEDGEVDYIVATDAIGMGLNLDINQVYFSGLEKFDGKYVRPLNDMEIGQIACYLTYFHIIQRSNILSIKLF